MDTRVTRSVRLVPEKWKIVLDYQDERELPSLGAAIDEMIDWWDLTKAVRERMRKETRQ